MDCPNCKIRLQHLPRGKKNKAKREAIKRRHKGGIETFVKGDTRKIGRASCRERV